MYDYKSLVYSLCIESITGWFSRGWYNKYIDIREDVVMGLAEKTFNKGEIIIKEGDVGKTLFYIRRARPAFMSITARRIPSD